LDFFSENSFDHEVSVASYPLFEYLPYESALASKIVDVTMNEQVDLSHENRDYLLSYLRG